MSAHMTRRWIVETKRDVFDDVGADFVEVTYGGALRFYDVRLGDDTDKTAVIYAPGQWLTVVPEADQ